MARDTEINVDVTVEGEDSLLRADRALDSVEQSAQDAGRAIDTTQKGFATIGQEAKQAGQSFTNFGNETYDATNTVTKGFDSMGRRIREVYRGTSPEAQRMSSEMRSAFAQQRVAMNGFRDDMIKTQYGYFELAKSSSEYTGSTEDFVKSIESMGKAHKKTMDNMMAANDMAKASFYQTVGAMMARSSQASKISDNFTRMNNPLYSVNKPLLGIADGLNKIAMRGTPAATALRLLGPTANMKQLNDMTMMIQQGMMRFPAVALIAAAGAAVFYTLLFKAAMGPNPADVRAKQAELTNVYKDAFNQRYQELVSFAGLFEKVSLKSVKQTSLMTALQSQVTAMKTWASNMKGLAKKGVDEGLIQELQKIGPKGAMEVKALNSMTTPELDRYVSLWRQKMSMAKTQATSELEGLRQATQTKIAQLQQTLTPLGIAVEGMKNKWVGAFGPMIALFGQIMTPVVNFIGKIGEMVIKFNEAHPTITKLVSAFMILVPILTVILSPLAIGIGLWAGLGAAIAAAAPVMMPIVTGFAAILGTVALVAVGIVALGAAFYLLWTRSETFKTGVISAWNSIKAAALAVWDFIAPYIQQAISAVTTFVQAKLAQLQAFWTTNGASIMAAVSNVWNVVLTVIRAAMVVIVPIIQIAFMLVKSIIVSTWNAIKNVINGTIQVIMGIIQVFTGLFTGNFSQMWAGVKQIFFGALTTLWGLINLYFIGKLLGPLRSFGTMAMGIIKGAWAFIKGIFTSAASGIATVIRMYFNMYRTIIMTVMNAIRTVVSAVWNALRSSVSAAVGSIRASISSAFSTARSIVTNAMQAIKSVVTSVWNAVKSSVTSVLSGILSSVKSTFSNMISAITSAMGKVGSSVKSGFDSALSVIKGIGSSFYNAGRGLIEQMIGGISSMAGAISDKVSSVVGKVRDFLPFSPAKVGPLSDLDKLDFGGPISDSIDKAFPKVSAQMNMLMGKDKPQPISPVSIRPNTYRPSMEPSPAAVARNSSSTVNKNNVTININGAQDPQAVGNATASALEELFSSMGRISPRTTEV